MELVNGLRMPRDLSCKDEHVEYVGGDTAADHKWQDAHVDNRLYGVGSPLVHHVRGIVPRLESRYCCCADLEFKKKQNKTKRTNKKKQDQTKSNQINPNQTKQTKTRRDKTRQNTTKQKQKTTEQTNNNKQTNKPTSKPKTLHGFIPVSNTLLPVTKAILAFVPFGYHY